MANVVVGDSVHISQSLGQHRLGPVESLYLTHFIGGEHDHMVRRVQIEPHWQTDFELSFSAASALRANKAVVPSPATHLGLQSLLEARSWLNTLESGLV